MPASRANGSKAATLPVALKLDKGTSEAVRPPEVDVWDVGDGSAGAGDG